MPAVAEHSGKQENIGHIVYSNLECAQEFSRDARAWNRMNGNNETQWESDLRGGARNVILEEMGMK